PRHAPSCALGGKVSPMRSENGVTYPPERTVAEEKPDDGRKRLIPPANPADRLRQRIEKGPCSVSMLHSCQSIAWAMVRDKVVKDDHVAGPERGDQDLLDVGAERGVIDRPVEHRGGGQLRRAECRDHRLGVPVIRRVIRDARRAAATSGRRCSSAWT